MSLAARCATLAQSLRASIPHRQHRSRHTLQPREVAYAETTGRRGRGLCRMVAVGVLALGSVPAVGKASTSAGHPVIAGLARAVLPTLRVSRVRPAGGTSAITAGTMAPCSNSSLHLTMSPCDNSVLGQVGVVDTLIVTVTNDSSGSENLVDGIGTCSGAVSSCSATPYPLTVPGNNQSYLRVIWTNSTTAGTGTIGFYVGGMNSTITVTVSSFTVDTTTTNLTDQMVSLCATACFAGMTSFSTVPYYTLSTPRNVTLVYNEDRVHPRPVIYADVSLLSGSATPTQYTLAATLNGTKVVFLTGDTTIYFSGSSAPVRLAGQFDATSNAATSTGIYTLVVTVTGTFSGSVQTHTYTQLLAIENESNSPIARGWTVAGVQRIYGSGPYLITDGAGNAVIFTTLGTAAADYSTLTYSSGTSTYTRTYLDGTTATFNATGFMTALTDRLGMETTYRYDTSNRLTTIVDPMRNTLGVSTVPYLTLGYNTTYGLNAIQEVGGPGGPGRGTGITIAADSTLHYITDPDHIYTTYTYDASKRLSTITDRRGGVTTYNYDAHSSKLTELDLPQIAADAGGGSTVNAIPKLKASPW
jgi:YD repeat-containing protein